MVDVPFINFAFPATGATANRTMPNRLAEIKNVVDFGADPTGGNAATTRAAIQAAVDANSGANRGVIYFPLGSYQIDVPITYNYAGNLSICFRGEQGANIFGSFNGYMFDRHSPTAAVTITIASPGVFTEVSAHGLSVNDPIRFVNQTVTGLLPTPLVPQATYYVKTTPTSTTYTVSATAGGTVINTSGSQSGVHTRGPINRGGGIIFERLYLQNGHPTGGGIKLGSTIGGAIRDCTVSAFICVTTEDAAGVSSRNINIENCTMAANSANVGTHYIIIGGGGSIQGCTLSGADTGVRAYGSGLSINGNRSERCNTSFLFGRDSADNNAGLSGLYLTATSTEGCWTAYELAGLCDGFLISSGALGHDAGNSGVTPGTGSQYGIRIRADCARNGLFQACTFGGDFMAQAAIEIANATSRANVVFRECSGISNSGGGVGWITPTNAYTARFINNNVNPVWTYSQLPTGGNVLEGDEFDISDSTTATWGANVTTGGGSNRVKVRYNNTNWTVVGK